MAAASTKTSRAAYDESTRANGIETAAPRRSAGPRRICDEAGTSPVKTTGCIERAGVEAGRYQPERVGSHLRPRRLQPALAAATWVGLGKGL